MGKLVDDTVLDGALNIIKNNCTQISVCADTPTTYSQATTLDTYRLALKTGLSGTDFTGPENDTSGRKLTTVQHSAISVTGTGTQNATHICLCSGSVLLYVTTCTSQAITNGNTVTIPAWKVTIGDPS